MWKSVTAFAGLLLFLIPGRINAANPGDNWANLSLVPPDNGYTFIIHDRSCISGKIAGVTDQAVTVEVQQAPPSASGGTASPEVRIKRSDLIYVKDGVGTIDIVYSGRSSWSDVLGIREVYPGEHLLLVTKDGKRREGRLSGTFSGGIQLGRWGRDEEISKSNVSLAYYVRTRPASSSVVRSRQNMFLIHPRLWPYMLGVAPKMKVLLYDASQPEDDRPIECGQGLPTSQ